MRALFLGMLFSLQFTLANQALALEDYADLVEQLSPAVVNIATKTDIKARPDGASGLPQGNPFAGTPFEELFEGFNQGREFEGAPRRQPERSLGSGVVISNDGFVVTNNHVIEGADEIIVKFNEDREEYAAELVGRDKKNDLALLKLEKRNGGYPFAELGNSEELRVGEGVLAIGNPFGLGGTVTAGIVSALSRNIGQGPYDDFIQTDAAINPGNSGGPLFNKNGEIIGINTAIFSQGGGSNGIGFAVPINTAKLVIAQIKEHGRPIRGWLGVRIQTVTEELAESFKLSDDIGALVSEVIAGSPAEKAGVRSGDVILKFNNADIEEMSDLPRLVAETPVGKRVPINIIRNGKEKALGVTIAELEEEEKIAEVIPAPNSENDTLGITAQALTAAVRAQQDISEDIEGVLILEVARGSAANEAGMQQGDIVIEVDWKAVTSIKSFNRALNVRKESVLLRIYRDDGYLFLPLIVR